ncbi:DUF3039 domain-containing protein [Pseudoglutamicibacter albus]|uniref:DUF3039 domain-containing protein n=1 Tax=Pseudoglutamicibacter albus TaxID=98671 RepID=UPI003DA89D24
MDGMSSINDPFANDPASTGGSPSAGGTAVMDRQLQEQLSEPGDHERFAHYVQKNKIMESAMTGEPVIALCGKVWVPGRDPQKFPVCPECKEVYDSMMGD